MIHVKHLKKIFENHFSFISKYITIGLITAVIYFSFFTIQLEYLNIHYKIAATTSYIFAILFHFNGNRIITFKAHRTTLIGTFIKYIFLFLLNYSINITILHISVETFGFSPYLGLFLGIGATTITGYLISRYWVFKLFKTI